MRITDVRVTRATMARVDPGWRTASYAASEATGFALEVEADGVVGIGGTAAHPNQISPDELEAQLRGPVMHALLGADAYAGNRVRQMLRDKEIVFRATLAADLALHDLVGKLANMPCCALWGGALRESLAVVRMVGIKAPPELLSTVRDLVDQGYTHFKVKIGTGLAEDVERIRALREEFGSPEAGLWIGIDGNGAYTPDGAIELSKALEPYSVGLIEQPIDYRDLDGLARVTAASAIPIMADQCVTDAASAVEVCRKKAAHVVSLKATKMGTLDECRAAAEVCQAFGIGVHIGGSVAPGVVDAAQAHFAASLPGVDEECEIGEFRAVTGDPTVGLPIVDGRVALGDAPGLGVSLAPVAAVSS
jgi:L-alanine-DL-glutamate epimerase-like enolase superfamily enzyme